MKISTFASDDNSNVNFVLSIIGLGKLNKMRKIEDMPAVRGMINKVKHLVDVEN